MLNTSRFPNRNFSLLFAGHINDQGQFAAQVLSEGTVLGTVGTSEGTFLRPFREPDDIQGFTYPSGINNAGLLCGFYDGFGGVSHGFFRHGMNYTTYDVPVRGVSLTTVHDVNEAGDFCGRYAVSGGLPVGYLNRGSTLTSIPIPGNYVTASGLNNLNQVVGFYTATGEGEFHGFFRDPDGTLTLGIDYPGAVETVPTAINDAGDIVGYWSDGVRRHGFVLRLPDTFISYDAPHSGTTYFFGINNSGTIVGTYLDTQFRSRALIAQLVEP